MDFSRKMIFTTESYFYTLTETFFNTQTETYFYTLTETLEAYLNFKEKKVFKFFIELFNLKTFFLVNEHQLSCLAGFKTDQNM